MEYQTFTEWINNEFKDCGLKPSELAREMGVTDKYINSYINGHRPNPTWETYMKFKRTFDKLRKDRGSLSEQ